MGRSSRPASAVRPRANSIDTSAGTVTVRVTETLEIFNGGSIATSTFSARNGGQLSVDAGNIILIGDDGPQNTGIFGNTEGAGHGGDVRVHAVHDIVVALGAEVSSGAFKTGSAGSVKVSSDRLLVDGAGSAFFTGISSSTSKGSTGDAGSVEVTVADIVVVRNGAEVASSTFGSGNAGSVKLVTNSLAIDGAGAAQFTGPSPADAGKGSTGNAGSITVDVAQALSIIDGGEIATSTFSPRAAAARSRYTQDRSCSTAPDRRV